MINFLFKLFSKTKISNCSNSICPVCDRRGVNFLPLSNHFRDQAIKYGYKYFGTGETLALDTYFCSQCNASDRERFYAYWINKQIQADFFQKGARLLHFAPEASLSKKLRELTLFNYQTADYMMEGVDYKVDITKMPEIDSEMFDFFICSHVLEHVDSDDKAIQELYRITKTGGCGILMAPISTSLVNTLEDPTKTSEADRWKHFGQNDHLRLYAHRDYVKKIKLHGFIVDELGVNYFGKEIFNQLGLKETSILYIVRKI